ncbi:MAG: substrate-binding domain-containing protein [Treponema sp.]|nr:substrate-binding domain-containing protein [Treponema sp.]
MSQNKTSIFTAIAYAAILLISLAACNKMQSTKTEEGNPAKGDDKPKVGFSIDTLALERWQRDLDVFMNKARELGAEVIVQNAGNSVEMQNSQLEYLMQRRVDTVVIVAKNREKMGGIIKRMRDKGIQVVSYDRLITGADISLYISVNTESVGRLMAQKLLDMGVGKNWKLILGPDEDYNMTLLLRGINDVIQNQGVDIKGIYYTAGWNYDLAYETAVSVLTESEIPDAIVCGNDSVAGSVLTAIDEYYPGRHIPICGQDADIAACQDIVRGRQDFTVYKPITELAEKAAECAVRLARGETAAYVAGYESTIDNGYKNVPVLWLEPQIATKENIDEVIIKSGFHTHGEVYK